MCEWWADEYEQKYTATTGGPRLDPGLSKAGMELFRGLPNTSTGGVLLATDLHPGNVLASRRDPWLLIDPKPYVGDPTYDPIQHMLNFPDRLLVDPLASPGAWLISLTSTLNDSGSGCSLAPYRSPSISHTS